MTDPNVAVFSSIVGCAAHFLATFSVRCDNIARRLVACVSLAFIHRLLWKSYPWVYIYSLLFSFIWLNGIKRITCLTTVVLFLVVGTIDRCHMRPTLDACLVFINNNSYSTSDTLVLAIETSCDRWGYKTNLFFDQSWYLRMHIILTVVDFVFRPIGLFQKG